MIYSAWGRDGVADTLVEGATLPEGVRKIDPGMSIIRTFEAQTWADAVSQFSAWIDSVTAGPTRGQVPPRLGMSSRLAAAVASRN